MTAPASSAESQLLEVGIGLQYIAAICDVPAGCAVQVGVASLALSSIDGSPIRIVEVHLRIPDPDDAAFLAKVLRLPQVARRTAADDWTWRGWLVGDSPHTLVSITLRSAPGATPGSSRTKRNASGDDHAAR